MEKASGSKEGREMSDGTTHWAGCSESGPKHYKCALLEIARLRNTITDLRVKLAAARQETEIQIFKAEKKPWVGLTDNDKEKCLVVREDRGWHGVLDAVEAKLREKNG